MGSHSDFQSTSLSSSAWLTSLSKRRSVGGEVEPVAALEVDDVGLVLDELDRLSGLSGGAVAALANRLFVVVGDVVLVEVAPQLHRPSGVKEAVAI
ncbi:hypothetical protein ACFXTN_042648 [Malus domestica]